MAHQHNTISVTLNVNQREDIARIVDRTASAIVAK